MAMSAPTCRVCLAAQGHFPLFADEAGVKLYVKIMACTAVQINPNDGFPSYICSACNAMLNVAFDFKTKCELSDLKLRHSLNIGTFNVEWTKEIILKDSPHNINDEHVISSEDYCEENIDDKNKIILDCNDDDNDKNDYQNIDRDLSLEYDAKFNESANESDVSCSKKTLEEFPPSKYKQSCSKSGLKQHMKPYSESLEWKHCDYCSHKYKTYKYVNLHFRSVHMANLNRTELLSMVHDDLSAVLFLQNCGVFPRTKICKNGHPMKIHKYRETVWRCRKRVCEFQCGVRKGTWLEGYRIPLENVIRFIYEWSYESTLNKDSKYELDISKATTAELNNSLREVCLWRMNQNLNDIGGPSLHVELGKSLFIRRRTNVDKKLPPQWVFGGICRETKNFFAVKVPDRSAATLLPIITERVRAGSIIITDYSKAYHNIENYGFEHIIVKNENENENLEPDTEANTQQINSMLGLLKFGYKNKEGNSRKHLELYLAEFMWRAQLNDSNIFSAILQEIVSFWEHNNEIWSS